MVSSLSLILRVLSCLVVMFTVVYSANIYVLLSICAIGFGEAAIDRAWKWRVVVDIAIGLAAGYLPLSAGPVILAAYRVYRIKARPSFGIHHANHDNSR